MIEYEDDFVWQLDAKLEAKIIESYAKIVQERKEGISGYFNLGKDSQPIAKEAELYATKSKFVRESDTVVVIGIGGSSLGTKAINAMLKPIKSNQKRMIFLENPDEFDLSEKLATIQKEKTVFTIVSKSGTTIETLSIFKKILEYFSLDYSGTDSQQILIITDEGSPLDKFAHYYGIKTYNIPKNVGGRFSVLSAVGIVPLTIAGYDTKTILNGANDMVERFFSGKENHLLKKAALLVSHRKEAPMNVVFSYANCLEDFTKWYVQLWGESLGKLDNEGKHTGLTPIGHIGSVDQHSFLQLIMQGPRDKTVTFIKLDTFEKKIQVPQISLKFLETTDYINGYSFNELIDGECEATKESIIKQGINVDAITLNTIEEHNIGELILYYELLTSLCGIMLDINTYDQPGVELGKSILLRKFSNS